MVPTSSWVGRCVEYSVVPGSWMAELLTPYHGSRQTGVTGHLPHPSVTSDRLVQCIVTCVPK